MGTAPWMVARGYMRHGGKVEVPPTTFVPTCVRALLPSLHQLLRDLHRVRRGAFSHLVTRHEEVDSPSVVATDVLPDPSDEHVVLSTRFKGHREVVLFPVVYDLHA